MTNLTCSILITLSTNWTTIGTFKPVCNQMGCLVDHHTYDVQEGRIETNFAAVVVYQNTRHVFKLETAPGPKIGERRIPASFLSFELTNWIGGLLVITNR